MPKFLKGTIILTIITLIAGVALGYVYGITKDPIAEAAIAKKQAAYKEVFPEADKFEAVEGVMDKVNASLEAKGYDKTTIDEIILAKTGSKDAGYVITVTNGSGYGGDVQFTVGIDMDSNVTGISFLSLSESPGLGMEARDNEEWAPQFYNKGISQFSVVKGETSSKEEISAISGATITSRAVTKGVNASLYCFEEYLKGGNK